MSDESRGEPAVRLERPVRKRRSRLRRLLRLAIVCLGVVVVVAGRFDIALVDRGHDCVVAVRDERRDAVVVCQRAYDDTLDPAIGVVLAKAHYQAHDLNAAGRLARLLALTSQRSDALHIIGLVEHGDPRNDRNDEALTALEEARQRHRVEHRPWQVADDDWTLALVRAERNEFAEALQRADECLLYAQLADDKTLLRRCHLTAAKTLIRVGYWDAAERELDIASPLAITGTARADVEYQRASLHQERGDHAQACLEFEAALQYDKDSQDTLWTLETELNLAYSLALNNQLDDAQHHLDQATVLDSEHEKAPERAWVAAEIAYQQKDLPRAASLVEEYFKLRSPDEAVDRDDQIDVATLGAQIELERGDLERARYWARRGVYQAERVRGAQSVLELRPQVLAKRRKPYELLFVALARSQQIESAVIVFNEWQGRTVQDALARSRAPAPPDRRDIVDQIIQLRAWLPVISQAPFARDPDPGLVLRTMRDIDLLALIVADNDVWRLTADHGPPRLSRIGTFREIKDLIDAFRGHPTRVQAASDLAARLLPDKVFGTTRAALHVLIDGRLAPLPVAALRRGGTPLVAMRPIVQVLRLPETRCVHVTRSGHATVLATLGGKLSHTREEAEQVAALLGATSEIGDAATRAALRAAGHDAVLHVAAHGDVGPDSAALVLADGPMSALEISVSRIAPSLAVLSACDAATSKDPELAGSLVAGFLGAGSQHVVATLSGIHDASAPEITTGFYRAGGVADPVRALARVQSELAETTNVDWPFFVVFGPDVCSGDVNESR